MKNTTLNKVLASTVLAGTILFGGEVLLLNDSSHYEVSAKVQVDNKIMGTSKASAYQLAQFVKNNKNSKVNLKGVTVDQLAVFFLEEGAKEGVRGDVAFAQAVLETGYFSFKDSSVTPDQHNYAGIGTTGGGVKGHYFKDARTGVRAQIQHLKAYASTEPLNLTSVDPRFKFVTRGIAPNYQDLQGRWAMKKGSNYGDVILRLYASALAIPNKATSVKQTEVKTSTTPVVTKVNYKTIDKVNYRASAGTSSSLLGQLPKGTSIVSIKTAKVGSVTWHYFSDSKRSGWVTSAYLKKEDSSKSKVESTKVSASKVKAFVTTADLNYRSSAGTNGKLLGKIPKGTKVSSSKTTKIGTVTWHYVTASKYSGWVSSSYLK